MMKLLYGSPINLDASTFYRGWGPICTLADASKLFDITHSTEFNWASLRRHQIVFASRLYTQDGLHCISIAKLNKKFVWLDYDDDLFNIPSTNPNTKITKDVHTVPPICKLVDVVTVSTKALAKSFEEQGIKAEVIPNAYDDSALGPLPSQYTYKNIIVWRGSSTHDGDLIPIQDQLVELINSDHFKDWQFLFFGHNPHFITSRIKPERFQILNPVDIMEYFFALPKLQAKIFFCPLKEDKFNLAKSNIAWLEATVAGSLCVASDLPEFKVPGCITAPHNAIVSQLADCMTRWNSIHVDFYNDARNHITKNLLLSEVNKQREKIIRQALKTKLD